MRWAKGRAAMTRSCARLRREAAIIFIALVICCVDLTARIRRRRSIRDGISSDADRLPRRRELLAEFLERRFERALDLVVQDLLVGDAGEHAGVARLEEAIQVLFVAEHVFDRHSVEEALRRRVDDGNLLL